MPELMYRIVYTNEFKRNLKAVSKRGYDLNLLANVVDLLKIDGNLPPEYRKHKLIGKYRGLYECHIQPDWLLVWREEEDMLVLELTNTGTHSDIFGK